MIGSTRSNSEFSSNNYLKNGVFLSPATPTPGESVRILYDGILSKDGAHQVFAHIGFGSNWENAKDYPMAKTDTGFEATIPVSYSDRMNICFKDCANNWDTNSNMNYVFNM